MKKLLIIASAFISLSSSAQSHFFDGYIKACNHPKSYMQFQKDLCKYSVDKSGMGSCKGGKVTLPPELGGKLVSTVNEGDFTMFKVKLDAPVAFAGNQVESLEQWSGHENGIWGTALVLEAKSVQEAKKNIAASGIKLKKEKSPILDSVGAEVVKGQDGRIRIMCDTSN